MLHMTGISAKHVDRVFTSTLVKSTKQFGEETRKVYQITLHCNGARAGSIEFLASAVVGCCSIKGIKSSTVEFDHLGVEKAFQGSGMSYLLIWCAAMKATHKGYARGCVGSISTVASFAAFQGAGFTGLEALDPTSRERMEEIVTGGAPRRPNGTKLRAQSGEVALATVRGSCEARIRRDFGATPTYRA